MTEHQDEKVALINAASVARYLARAATGHLLIAFASSHWLADCHKTSRAA